MHKLIAILMAASALTGAAVDAEAKGPKPSRRSYGPGLVVPHGHHSVPANVLSKSELQWCVNTDSTIDTNHANIVSGQANIDAREARVDQYSQRSVDAFNALVDAHNEKVRASNLIIDDWNSRCANRSYYVRDMDAIRAGR
jgi:hypothetical protein